MRRWNDDPYTKRARREGYLARSVFKLEEIDRRERLLETALRILDLGAAPGSWSQYCLKKIRSPDLKIWAIDLVPLKISDKRLQFVQADVRNFQIEDLVPQHSMDLVLSDVAPKTTGISTVDTEASFELSARALEIASLALRPQGSFVTKLFMGDSFELFHDELNKRFEQINLLRPEGSRKHSREIFFIAKRLKVSSKSE